MFFFAHIIVVFIKKFKMFHVKHLHLKNLWYNNIVSKKDFGILKLLKGVHNEEWGK